MGGRVCRPAAKPVTTAAPPPPPAVLPPQRIMRMQYWFPSTLGLSPDCLDLLGRIFVRDPAQRIDLAGIQRHPWFLKNLPPECQVGGWAGG